MNENELQQPTETNTPVEPKKKNITPIIIVIAVVLLAGGIIFFLTNNNKNQDGSKTTTTKQKETKKLTATVETDPNDPTLTIINIPGVKKIYKIPQDASHTTDNFYIDKDDKLFYFDGTPYPIDKNTLELNDDYVVDIGYDKDVWDPSSDGGLPVPEDAIDYADGCYRYIKNAYDIKGNTILNNVKLCETTSMDDGARPKYYYGSNAIYDENFKKLMDIPTLEYTDITLIVNDYIYIYGKGVYSIPTKKQIAGANFKNFNYIEDYILFKENKKPYIVNTKDNSINIDYSDYSCYGYVTDSDPEFCTLKKDNETYYLTNNEIFKDKIKLTDNIYADYTKCKNNNGGILVNDKGESIDSVCHQSYTVVSPDVIIGNIANYYETQNHYDDLYIKGKRITSDKQHVNYDKDESENIEVIIEYTKDNSTYTIVEYKHYDLNGNYIDTTNHSTYRVHKVSENEYGYIVNGALTYKNLGEKDYRVYYDGKELFHCIGIDGGDRTLEIETLFERYILEFGDGVSKLELHNPAKSVDVNKIIKDYSFEEYEQNIKDNKEFVQEYYYQIEKETAKKDYKDYFIKLIPLLTKPNISIHKYALVDSILAFDPYDQKLGKNEPPAYREIDDSYAYYTVTNSSYSKEERISYGILTTILDENHDYNEVNIYDPELQNKSEVLRKQSLFYFNEMEDGLPQIINNKYLYKETKYTNQMVKYYNVLIAIFGYDTIEKLYFERYADVAHYNFYLDNGLTTTDISKINEIFRKHNFWQKEDKLSKDETKTIKDYLIKLYNNKNPNKNYKDDKEFVTVLNNL